MYLHVEASNFGVENGLRFERNIVNVEVPGMCLKQPCLENVDRCYFAVDFKNTLNGNKIAIVNNIGARIARTVKDDLNKVKAVGDAVVVSAPVTLKDDLNENKAHIGRAAVDATIPVKVKNVANKNDANVGRADGVVVKIPGKCRVANILVGTNMQYGYCSGSRVLC